MGWFSHHSVYADLVDLTSIRNLMERRVAGRGFRTKWTVFTATLCALSSQYIEILFPWHLHWETLEVINMLKVHGGSVEILRLSINQSTGRVSKQRLFIPGLIHHGPENAAYTISWSWITVKNEREPIFNNFGIWNRDDIWHKWLCICPPHLKNVTALPCEM